ncbi:MAG: dihydroorotase [Candidatus Omnitrophota bacterium]|nr:MAG: dihydroorotase [Candidatus Omnitrophota bacterium]
MRKRRILVKQGRVIDPNSRRDEITDILICEERICKIEKEIKEKEVEVIDARGKIVIPGLVDIHTHLREPGREDEESIKSGAEAGAKGGFTTLCCMANTQPVVDNQEVVRFIYEKAKEARINIYPFGAVSKGLKGEELAEFGELKEAGVIGLSDDGRPISDAKLLRRALEYAQMFSLIISVHSEEERLSERGQMNEGFFSTKLGLEGIPDIAESIAVARDIQIAEFLHLPLHFAHISTRKSVDLIREAKKRGVRITCETAPQYFSLEESLLCGFDTNLKVNPPLRSKEDVEAIKEGLSDGTIDAIASDHAPHSEEEKNLPFDKAPFGSIGLETALAVGITELVEKKVLTLSGLIEKMSLNPARIFNLPAGELDVGKQADLVVVDMDRRWKVKKEDILSRSKNSAFLGRELKGLVMTTICKGEVVYTFNGDNL